MSTNNEISLFQDKMHKTNFKAFKEIFNNRRKEVIKMKYHKIQQLLCQIRNVNLCSKTYLKLYKIKKILFKMRLKKRLKSFQFKI